MKNQNFSSKKDSSPSPSNPKSLSHSSCVQLTVPIINHLFIINKLDLKKMLLMFYNNKYFELKA